MTLALIAIVILALLGVPASLALEPRLRGAMLAGVAFLMGCGVAYVLLFLLSIARIPWSLSSVGLSALIATALMSGLAWKRVQSLTHPPGGREGERARGREDLLSPSRPPAVSPSERSGRIGPFTPSAVDLLTAAAVLIHGLYSTNQHLWGWSQTSPLWRRDFWSIWGLKAQLFHAHHGIDWTALGQLDVVLSHPDYPLMVPLLLDWLAMMTGEVASPHSGLLFTAFGAAWLLIARTLLQEELQSATASAAATLGLSVVALTIYIGVADGPFLVFGTSALLLVRRWNNTGDPQSLSLASVLLGLAALTKNEGLALILAVAVAATVAGGRPRRELWRLWPAMAMAASWLIPVRMFRLGSDLLVGDPVARAVKHLRDPISLLQAFSVQPLENVTFWMVLTIALASMAPSLLHKERLVLLALFLQLLAYLAAYLISPHDLGWHVASSWNRLPWHFAAPLSFIVFAAALQGFSPFPLKRGG